MKRCQSLNLNLKIKGNEDTDQCHLNHQLTEKEGEKSTKASASQSRTKKDGEVVLTPLINPHLIPIKNVISTNTHAITKSTKKTSTSVVTAVIVTMIETTKKIETLLKKDSIQNTDMGTATQKVDHEGLPASLIVGVEAGVAVLDDLLI
jgi:invasion protein IalB